MNTGNGAVTLLEGLEDIRREGGINTSGTSRGHAVLPKAVGQHLQQLLALMLMLTPCRKPHCASLLLLESEVQGLLLTPTLSSPIRRSH